MQSAVQLSDIVGALQTSDDDNDSSIRRALKAIRAHLGMEIAYVSEFVGNSTVFREVDAPGLENLIKVGDAHSLDDVYCKHILEGRLPSLMPDTSAVPFAAAMPITAAVPIGKHMSVPLRMKDGEVYGMFCCLGPGADTSLSERDLKTMNVFAEFAAFELQREAEHRREVQGKLKRIASVIADEQLSMVYQPIFDLATERKVGFECLARFATTPYRTPDVWFKEADEINRGPYLEIAAIAAALTAFSNLSQSMYLAVNASPATVLADGFVDVLAAMPLNRVVLEITEHALVQDYNRLMSVIDPLRERGLRLAVDDAGAGYSGLQHILKLRPDVIKLDISLTRDIDTDLSRRALASAMIGFAGATGSSIVAEGVETASELATLKLLGAHMAQGYFLGKPMPMAAASKLD